MVTQKEIDEMEVIDFSESGIPERMWEGLTMWVKFGIWPGGFLSAVITNDLFGAVGRADYENMQLLHNYCRALFNDVPSGCYGSQEKAEAWHKKFHPDKAA